MHNNNILNNTNILDILENSGANAIAILFYTHFKTEAKIKIKI